MAEFIEVMKQRSRMCDDCKDKGSFCNVCRASLQFISEDSKDFEDFVMKWAKENPVKTNADKFKEIINEAFGEGIVSIYVTGCSFIKCPHPELICDSCEYRNFWNKEYKEPKKDDK